MLLQSPNSGKQQPVYKLRKPGLYQQQFVKKDLQENTKKLPDATKIVAYDISSQTTKVI